MIVNRETKSLLRGGLTALLFAIAGIASAQDWPNLQSNDARTGVNTNPAGSGPGFANLNWFQPLANFNGFIRQVMSPEASHAASNPPPDWVGYGPAQFLAEALMTYAPVQTGNAVEDAASGFTAYQAAGANAIDYDWSYCIPSSTDPTQPTTKLNPTDSLNTFTWLVEPADPAARTASNMALYAWIPIGPTNDPAGPGGPPNNYFPQEFFVYQITDSAGGVYTDVMDTFIGGTGWVKLGGGGRPTNRTFQYDGVTPIKITLFNTIPRTPLGNLSTPAPCLVYADAVLAVPSLGYYHSSPIVSATDPVNGTGNIYTTTAKNNFFIGKDANGRPTTIIQGEVDSYDYNTGKFRWHYTPAQDATLAYYLDTTNTSLVTSSAPWAVSNVNVGAKGATHLIAPIVGTLANASNVIYDPQLNLHDGNYLIQAWLPGSGGGEVYGQAVTYEIHEGATVSLVTVNQDSAGGWFTLGGRRFVHDMAGGNPLKVYVLNYSAQAGDLGKSAFADAIHFIGQANLAIDSTPVQATTLITPAGGGAPVLTAVTLVAAEDGRVYCLDSTGDGHGGTTLYWAYPSLPAVVNDPNQQVGFDGPGPTAEMPTGFNLSSALVETVAGHPYLYIGSANGRVYCLDMEGRGDTTTTRVWSYPDDYPSPPKPSTLGPIAGSLSFVNDGIAPPEVIVPAQQGRIYALNALGAGGRTTFVQWAFPAGDESDSPFATYTSAVRAAGDSGWANPGNAQFVDQVYTTVTPDNGTATGFSQYLEGTGPTHLAVPPGATVLGIQARVIRHRTAGDPGLFIHDEDVYIVKGGVIQTVQNKADKFDDWPLVDMTQIYGGQTDLWGQTWVSTDFGAGFGVALAVHGNGDSTKNTTLPTANVDYVEVRVFFQGSPTTGPIITSPTVAFGNVYFGTLVKPGDPGGVYYALNQDTGALAWSFTGTNLWNGGTGAAVSPDGFSSGSVAIPATELNKYGANQSNSIVVMNDNLWLTSLFADGPNAGQVQWTTQELQTPVKGSLSYTPLTVADNSATGTTAPAPCVMVPTADGRFDGLFAMSGNGFGATNRFGTRRAWEYVATAQITSSMSVGRGFMYGADENGILYAFGNGSSVSGPNAPGYATQTENQPGFNGLAEDFRQTIVGFVPASIYQAARAGTLTYQQLQAAAQTTFPGGAADWGQTVYVAVFSFPYTAVKNPSPPIVTYQFSVAGESIRNLSIQSQGPIGGTAPNSTTGDGVVLDGYAILPFTLQGGGSNSLAPGPATVTASINTSGTTNPPQSTNVALKPGLGSSFLNFAVANPLALVMRYSGGTAVQQYQIGYTPYQPGSPQNLVNGNPASAIMGADNVTLLTAPLPAAGHGQNTTYPIGVVDRSLMTLLRGPTVGLENVRLERSDLAWQYDTSPLKPILNAIPPGEFPSFEDYPINLPNDSLDYPDIQREQVTAVKDPNGTAENPLFNGVTLNPPTLGDPTGQQRTLQNTEWDMGLNIPRFQPPNNTTRPDSAGGNPPAGYRGMYYVYVDSFGQGTLQTEGNQREAYRTFWLDASVLDDRSAGLLSTTSNLDLGSLDGGTGYSNQAPSDFSPWGGPYSTLFKQFNVTNRGNVNYVDLRVAQSIVQGGASQDIALNNTNGNSLDWLDATNDVHTDINTDPSYQLLTSQVILQKARTTDRNGTTLSSNPIKRPNANLGITNFVALRPDLPSNPPRITVSVPFGLPVGTYQQLMRVVENDQNGHDNAPVLNLDANPSFFTDPGFTLTYHVRETRLTSKSDNNVAPLIDTYDTGNLSSLYANSQPAPFRDANGGVHVGFTSARPVFNPVIPGLGPPPATSDQTSIYFSSLHGNSPVANQYPLNDLTNFIFNGPAGWFSQDVGPYPTQTPSQLFIPPTTSYTINGNAVPKYTWPAFPSSPYNLFTGAANGNPYVAFIGEDQVNTGNATLTNSKVFIVQPTLTAGGMNFGAPPKPLPDDIQNPSKISGSIKQKPAVLQFGANATVLYSTNGSGHGQIFVATYDGANWTSNVAVALPSSFETVSVASASARMCNLPSGRASVIELAISAKLSGRPSADIFFARIACSVNGIPLDANNALVTTSGKSAALIPLTTKTFERLGSTKSGVFQASGVNWDLSQTPQLFINGNPVVTGIQVDSATGTISYDNTVLGGKVYLNPSSGTVQFSGNTPTGSVTVQLSYTPRLLRVNAGTTNDLSPTIMYDYRNVAGSNYSYWSSQNAAIPVDRYVFTYGATSTGGGQAARTYMSTYRLGVQLPTAVATDNAGNVVNLTVTGNTSFYQIDPVNGRVYFTDLDEGNNVTITYIGADAAGNQVASQTVNGVTVTLISETAESPLPVEGAVNEAQLTSFLDPFNATPRPGLIWLFWTSTRNGWPDIYFQTIAPNFAPTVSSK